MYRALLVDDERIIMEGMKSILEGFDMGFDDISIVEDGKEALEALDRFKPDLIITDIKMSYMDGLELLKVVRSRRDRLKDTPVIIVSGYSDFSYAKSAIEYGVVNYLLKPVRKQELHDTLLKITRNIKKNDERSMQSINSYDENRLYMRVLRRQYKDQNEFEKLISLLDIQFCSYSAFQLAEFITGNAFEPADNSASCLGGAKMKDIVNKISTAVNHDNSISLLRVIYLEDKVIFLFALKNSHSAGGNDPITDLFTTCINGKTNPLDGNVFISSSFMNISGLADAYEQLRFISRCRKIMPEKPVINYEDVQAYNREGELFLKETLKIIEGIEHNNLKQLMDQFNAIDIYMKSNYGLSVKYIESIYRNILMEIYTRYYTLDLYHMYPEVLDELADHSKIIENSISRSDIHAKCRQLVTRFFEVYNKSGRKLASGDDIVCAVKKFIAENYYNPDFSQQQAAEMLNITGSYLCTLFKKGTGISFTDYLCNVRINKAIELLGQSEIPAYEIGRRIGYSSEKHFFHIFKKYTGYSPISYRNKLLKT